MMNCKEVIDQYLQFLTEGFSCRTEGPYFVIETPYLYSDGDAIDLYLESAADLAKISDLGETTRHLEHHNFNWKTKRAHSLFSHIVASTNVSSSQGVLYIKIFQGDAIGERISDLLQAIQQTDNLLFTIQTHFQHDFSDDVESYLREQHFEPELNYMIQGMSGYHWSIPFFINHNSNICIKPLSAVSMGSARNQTNAIYAEYDDIHRRYPQYVRTVILENNEPTVWTQDHLVLLRQVVDTDIGLWSSRDNFFEKINALQHS